LFFGHEICELSVLESLVLWALAIEARFFSAPERRLATDRLGYVQMMFWQVQFSMQVVAITI
jgi:hypothetical protein